ncbi:MAG: ornithine carbamoyltransferase [Phycisphaerales bacterium]
MSHAPSMKPLSTKDLVTSASLTEEDLRLLLETAASTKRDIAPFRHALDGRSVVLLFEKPSLRTRLTFEVGVHRLGGQAIYYDHAKERIGQRETTKDYAKNLERWVAAIVARTYAQATVEQLAVHARIPVINALSDAYHPCQALADVLTLHERFGKLRGLRVAYIGDGCNTAVSLMHLCPRLGVELMVITPAGYEPPAAETGFAMGLAMERGTRLSVSNDPRDVSVAGGVDAVYTDTWVSMHLEHESDARERAFAPYQVNATLMSRAAPHAVFMHCLPAHRGEEVTDDVIDSPRSLVYEQAENRLHAQNAVLLHTIGVR